MYDLAKLRAIGAMVARQAREKAAADPQAANDIIDMAPLLKEWMPGTMDRSVEHAKDEVTVHDSLPWLCIIGHTHHGEPGWEPGGESALWAQYHGRDAEHALPFKAEGHNPYMAGDFCTEDGKPYECVVNNTVCPPSVLPENWMEGSV